mgnify:CR=1 FL=1
MDDTTLNQIVMVVYMVSAAAFLWTNLAPEPKRWRIPMGVAWLGFGLHTSSLIWRWIHSYQIGIGHAPLTNRYESFVFFAWSIVAIFLVFDRFLGLRRFGAAILAGGAGLIGVTSLIPGMETAVTPLMPALQSNWLFFHVVTCFLAYAAFAVAFFTGIMSLTRARGGNLTRESSLQLDDVMYRMIMVGFLLLTLGIISGSAWAYRAWGRYWGFDPKETWSLITWIVYAVFLHARITKGWAGKRLALIAIIGFLSVIVTYWGVNHLDIFKGLHSYG